MRNLAEFGFIYGKFQPFHLGHLDYVKSAAKKCKILFIGIAYPDLIQTYPKDPDKPENTSPVNNPFNFHERLMMITHSLLDVGIVPGKFFVIPHEPIYLRPDKFYNYFPKNTTIFYGIISAWEKIKLKRAVNSGFKVDSFFFEDKIHISATEIRRRMTKDENWEELVPNAVSKIIKQINGVGRVKELSKKYSEFL